MADGGNDASGGAPVTSGVIMAAGGQHSDSQRLSKDLEDISASHLTESDCEEELHGEEDEADLKKLPGDGKLQHDLLSHQYGHNTPSKKRSRTPRSAVWNTVKRIKDKALLGPVLRQSDDGRENTTYTHVCIACKQLLKLGYDQKACAWKTTKAFDHFKDSPVTEHDKLSTLLDPRTNNCKHLRGKPGIDVHAMRLALQDEYVKWAMRTREWLGLDSVSEEEDEDEGNAEEVVDEDDIPGLFAPEEKEEPKHVKPSPARKPRPEEAAREAEEQFRKDFDRHWKAYNIRSQSIDWTQVPGVSKPEDRSMIWKDLWSADMSYVMKKFFLDDKECEDKYGHLPKMAVASKGMMGSVMASSFCERINSCANVVCTKNNSLLSDDEIDKVVTLRMNRDFMEFMRAYYPDVIKSTHPKYGSLITADDVKEERVRAQEQEVDMFD